MDKDATAESVSFKLDELETDAHSGDCLFKLAQNLGTPLPSSCNQSGKCRECLIEVLEGESLLTSPSAEEKGMSHGYRLACRSRIRAASGQIRCRTLRRSPIRIEEDGQPYTRLLQQDCLSSFPLRPEKQLQYHQKRLQDAVSHYYGLAIDIGTTTVVVRLMDLESGRIAASHSFENPQRFGGSDVMARIRFSDDDPTQSLKRVLVGYINNSIRSFPVESREIVDVVVAGNTTMRDLFFGLDVSCLGQLPFRSTLEKEWLNRKRVSTSYTASPSRIGLLVHPEARVYGLPLIGSHVGADTAACLLVTNYLQSDETALLIDIGTNTEIVCRFSGRILAASCPAGPAFEGGFVKCGMPALEGAIEKVRLKNGKNPQLEVIGSVTPTGICGTGLISILGELLRTERINNRGRLNNHQHRFLLDREHSIFIDEQDISNLAQAKAANAAGISILTRQIGCRLEQISKIYLAGAFARHLDLEAARRIGLLPPIPDQRFVRLGNASIEGATLALLSENARRELEQFVTTIEHVELETDPAFFDAFVDGCLFQPFR